MKLGTPACREDGGAVEKEGHPLAHRRRQRGGFGGGCVAGTVRIAPGSGGQRRLSRLRGGCVAGALQGRQLAALAAGFDERKLSLLVRSNWIRVAAWSAAAIMALWMCRQVLAQSLSRAWTCLDLQIGVGRSWCH